MIKHLHLAPSGRHRRRCFQISSLDCDAGDAAFVCIYTLASLCLRLNGVHGRLRRGSRARQSDEQTPQLLWCWNTEGKLHPPVRPGAHSSTQLSCFSSSTSALLLLLFHLLVLHLLLLLFTSGSVRHLSLISDVTVRMTGRLFPSHSGCRMCHDWNES